MTTPLTVKFKLQHGGILPLKAHQDDAGFDLFVPADVKLTDDPVVIDTKVCLEIPTGYFGMVTARSSASLRGIDVSVGIIDSNYRGPIHILARRPKVSYDPAEYETVYAGQSIAQLIIMPYERNVLLSKEAALTPTDRQDGRFGSSGGI